MLRQGAYLGRRLSRIHAPKKWVAGARKQTHSTVGRCIHRALINRSGRMKGRLEGEWVEVALSNRHVQQVCMQVTIPTSSGTFPSFTYLDLY